MKILKEFKKAARRHDVDLMDDKIDLLEKLISLIPILLIVLRLLKIFTGQKVDEKIDEIIEWMNSIVEK
jgi:hypothetical protein